MPAQPERPGQLPQALRLGGERDPAGPVATNSGLMPNGSRAPNSTRSWVSQIRKANIPRSRATAAGPQWW